MWFFHGFFLLLFPVWRVFFSFLRPQKNKKENTAKQPRHSPPHTAKMYGDFFLGWWIKKNYSKDGDDVKYIRGAKATAVWGDFNAHVKIRRCSLCKTFSCTRRQQNKKEKNVLREKNSSRFFWSVKNLEFFNSISPEQLIKQQSFALVLL